MTRLVLSMLGALVVIAWAVLVAWERLRRPAPPDVLIQGADPRTVTLASGGMAQWW
jgi:hypothetical protein